MWFQSASDSSHQNSVIHKFTLNIYTMLLCAPLGLIGLWNSSKSISKIRYLTLFVSFSCNALLNKQASLYSPSYGAKGQILLCPWQAHKAGFQFGDVIKTAGIEFFQKFHMQESKRNFQKGERFFWQIKGFSFFFPQEIHDISNEVKN